MRFFQILLINRIFIQLGISRDIINGRNDLPVPAHFNQPNHTLEDMKVAVLKAGLANQE